MLFDDIADISAGEVADDLQRGGGAGAHGARLGAASPAATGRWHRAQTRWLPRSLPGTATQPQKPQPWEQEAQSPELKEGRQTT